MSDAVKRTNNEEDIALERKVYTPDTEEVREAWGEYKCNPPCEECPKEFDRWLGVVKAQAVAEWLAERMAAFEKVTLEDYEQGETE